MTTATFLSYLIAFMLFLCGGGLVLFGAVAVPDLFAILLGLAGMAGGIVMLGVAEAGDAGSRGGK